MEPQTPSSPHETEEDYYHSTVDTSRPFASVKEAVEVFGQKLLTGEIYSSSPKPFMITTPRQASPWMFSPSPIKIKTKQSEELNLANTVKKLEGELEETKAELRELKERESETEVALASLNAELHKNMSKIALAEAALARAESLREEEVKKKRREMVVRVDEEAGEAPTRAQILSFGEEEGLSGGRKRERKMMKKKPIIPLLGDLFSRRGKGSSLHSSLFESTHAYLN